MFIDIIEKADMTISISRCREIYQVYRQFGLQRNMLFITWQGKEAMNMKVIVGKELHSTPVFNDKMEHIVLAPYWNIPPGILKEEIAPSVMANPGYLASKDMETCFSLPVLICSMIFDLSQPPTLRSR